MIIETLLYNQLQDLNTVNEHFENQETDDINIEISNKNKQWCNPKLKVYLLIIIKIISTSIAVYLAWDCNRKTKKWFKYIILILAALFSDFYILFYFIYRILLKNECNVKKTAKVVSNTVAGVTKVAKLPKVAKLGKNVKLPKAPKLKLPKTV